MKRNRIHRPTMRDVAERAGVTIGTVSHVINHTAPISLKTTKKVKDAIKELNYIPNSNARDIRNKKNNRVGLMIPNLKNEFFSSIASRIVELADRDKYIVYIMGYEYSIEKEKNILRSLVEYNVGTVIIANGYGDEDLIQELNKTDMNIIFADRKSTMKEIPSIEFDNKRIPLKVVSLLKSKGYKSIGYISETLELTNVKERYEGYVEAMQECGFTINPDHVIITNLLQINNVENGYKLMKALLKEKAREELPDAFIVTSDMAAIGVMKAMHEAGYKIPGDFGVVGCDDILLASFTYPGLTTIRQDCNEFCDAIWKMVIGMNNNEKVENIVLSQELVVRESI